jgi:hypothetical protein
VTASADTPLKIDTVMSSPENNHAEDMPLKLNIRIRGLSETDMSFDMRPFCYVIDCQSLVVAVELSSAQKDF